MSQIDNLNKKGFFSIFCNLYFIYNERTFLMKKNKPKKYHCSDCNYSSENLSEFGFVMESDGDDTFCLDCIEKDKKQNLSSFHTKIAEGIRDRKKEGSKCKILFLREYQSQEKVRSHKKESIVFPKHIKDFLNKRIIGQDNAKNKISTAIANHLRTLSNPALKFEKSNVLLIGPTGTGKTEFFRTISKELDIPFTSCTATNLTAAGYVGQDVSQILAPLVNSTEDIFLAERGIVFIDEVDKLAGDGDSNVNTVRIQQELLKMIEGDIVQVNIGESKNHPHYVDIDTKNILFICAGAFSGLKENVLRQEKTVGLTNTETKKQASDWTKELKISDLTKYGLIPEFLGRLPIVTFTEELTVETLEKILTQPEQNLVSQYRSLFHSYDVDLVFSTNFLKTVASEAHSQGLGARGLKKIMEEKLSHIMENVDLYQNKSIVIKGDCSIEVEKNKMFMSN
jgi:ATP-dependent Clp protease ATP-binding subunit ClpX